MPGSVERALRILVELGSGPTTISELGRQLGVHRTTSLRLLRTLEDERFVRRSVNGTYRLGPRVAMLAHRALEEFDVRAAAATHLRTLGARFGHTVHLAALEGRQVIYLDKVESRHAIRMYSRIGATAPLHATAVGKTLLAFTPSGERDELLGEPPFRHCTANTRTTHAELDKELAEVVDRGWALDDFEHEDLIHCVAAPVRDVTGDVKAAVSISVPHMVLDRTGLLSLAPEVVATARAVSEELGWETDTETGAPRTSDPLTGTE